MPDGAVVVVPAARALPLRPVTARAAVRTVAAAILTLVRRMVISFVHGVGRGAARRPGEDPLAAGCAASVLRVGAGWF
ncbi:hypothetical protein GCM10010442_71670 [Kitasatospora kifunensis]